MRKGVFLGLLTVVIIIGTTTSTQAASAVSSALAGAEVAGRPYGLPLNPAASARADVFSVQVGAELPFDQGWHGYVAVYEPKDARGAALPGVLGMARFRSDTNSEATVTTYTYQLADRYSAHGALGLGFQLLRAQHEVTGEASNAWQLDVGWQGELTPQLSLGVVGLGVLGTASSAAARKPEWQIGTALTLADGFTAAFDMSDFRGWQPTTYALGAELAITSHLLLRGGYALTDGVGQATTGLGLRGGSWRLDAGATLGEVTVATAGMSIAFE